MFPRTRLHFEKTEDQLIAESTNLNACVCQFSFFPSKLTLFEDKLNKFCICVRCGVDKLQCARKYAMQFSTPAIFTASN